VRLRDRWPAETLARYALWSTLGSAALLALFVYLAGHDAVNDPQPLNGLFARQSLLEAVGYPAVLATMLVALALSPSWLQRPITNAPLRWAADISYGVYLIHFAVIWLALQEFSISQDGSVAAAAAWAALVYPVSTVYAYLSARFVERPIRRWAHRFGRRSQAPAPTPA
jgi:peptidoglycan/LPS O-acetylase OafA/YrhL